MFCAPGIIFGGTEGVRSHFHVLCYQTHFRRYQERHVSFSCFALPNPFSTVLRASGPVFKFCAPGLVFVRTDGVGPVLMFCAHGLIFGGTEGAGSRFNVLRSPDPFLAVHQVSFSCFALPKLFSAVPRASCHIFMFALQVPFSTIPTASGPVFILCALGLIFGGLRASGLVVRPFLTRSAPPLWAMRCRGRTQRSLLSVHLFSAD
jgi:hypothetical protein